VEFTDLYKSASSCTTSGGDVVPLRISLNGLPDTNNLISFTTSLLAVQPQPQQAVPVVQAFHARQLRGEVPSYAL